GMVRVESRRDHDEPGGDHAEQREHDLLEEVEVPAVSDPRGQRDVDRRPLAGPFAGVLKGPGARIPRFLMERAEYHRRLRVEDLLGAVSVVDVPIQDEDPPRAVRAERPPGRERGVVEDAEPPAGGGAGVMPRGPEERKR